MTRPSEQFVWQNVYHKSALMLQGKIYHCGASFFLSSSWAQNETSIYTLNMTG